MKKIRGSIFLWTCWTRIPYLNLNIFLLTLKALSKLFPNLFSHNLAAC